MKSPVIHIKNAVKEIERKDDKGRSIPFSARILKKDGGVALFENTICTSSYHNGTMKFYTPASQTVRTIHVLHLIELNGKEVVI